MKKILELKEWSLRKDPTGQLPATLSDHNFPVPATVPGCVHTDLLNAGLIPDPFFADNEVKLEWIHLNNWIYSTEFNLLPDFNPQEPIYLIFEGLDTLADISLNGKRVASTHNMFREYSFRVDHLLRGDSNQITIKFTSPVRGAQSLEKRHGKLAVSLNSERVYLRKAQYSFGWDWGPSFPTMGIWKPAYLMQRGSSRISSLQLFTSDLKRSYARVNLQLILDGKIRRSQLFAELKDPQGKIIASGKSKAQKTVDFDWIIENPVLWWPNGEGEQNLHTLTVCLLDATGGETDCLEKRVGIRTIQLQTENKSKNIFRFLINNQPVYIKGSNWIPADSFLPRISPRKYRSLLQMAADAHMNMVRIWGGGIYEQDIFYDICDELGLLVWQDFMFACGSYPVLPEFLENVKAEVEQVVRRFQYHPCIALWCGNNENEWIWYHTQPGPLTNMYDYRIYHKLLPALVKKLDPGCPYWPSSPFGFDRDPNSPTSGNRHEWDIWSSWVDYEKVKSDHSLFVTEFGFQGPANFHTLEKVIPPDHRKTCDPLFDFHNKQIEGNERLFRFLSGHFPVHSNWWDFIYLTQLNQGMALKTCLEQWRFYSAVTSGSIIWQLNDCWPVISWS
jgi:beta-mannosidase